MTARSSTFRPARMGSSALLSVALLGASLVGCGVEEVVMEPFRGETPHERYYEALERAGLTDSELARGWLRAAREAIESPVDAALPRVEEGRFGPEEPMALGYRIDLERGQRLEVGFEVAGDWGPVEPRVFLEVFRIRGDPEADEPRLLTVAWGESDDRAVTYEARSTSTYIVRVQPELLAGGEYRVTLRVGPSLAFPVLGRDTGAILSYFGAPRDGGRRQHHGVDIFAPRGTPVLAAGEGTVSRVDETPIGGRIVWVRDRERGISQYYAHMDTQLVERGQRVVPGDTVGLVGNSGNAITTPPHLHFGIYMRGEGPVNPWSFLHDPGGNAVPLRVARDEFRAVRRIGDSGGPVYAGPSRRSSTLADVPPGVLVRVVGGSGDYFRVRLPDGRQGYAAPSVLEDPGPDARFAYRPGRRPPTEAAAAPSDPTGVGAASGSGGF